MSCASQRIRSFFVLTRRKIFTVESLSISSCQVRALLLFASASYKVKKKHFRCARSVHHVLVPDLVLFPLRPKLVNEYIRIYGSDQMDD